MVWVQGFVSNKDMDVTGGKGDPVEALLYAVFVASSAHVSVMELASILNVDLARLQSVVSIACRLGFAKKVEDGPALSDQSTATGIDADEASSPR